MKGVSDINLLEPELGKCYDESKYGFWWLVPVVIIDIIMLIIGLSVRKSASLPLVLAPGMLIVGLIAVIAYICLVNHNYCYSGIRWIDIKLSKDKEYLLKDGANKLLSFYIKRLWIGMVLCFIGVALIAVMVTTIYNFVYTTIGESNYGKVTDFSIPTATAILVPIGHFILCLGVYYILCGMRRSEFNEYLCKNCGCLFSIGKGKTLESEYDTITESAYFDQREETVGHIELSGGRSIAVTGNVTYYTPEKKYATSYEKYERVCCHCGNVTTRKEWRKREIK